MLARSCHVAHARRAHERRAEAAAHACARQTGSLQGLMTGAAAARVLSSAAASCASCACEEGLLVDVRRWRVCGAGTAAAADRHEPSRGTELVDDLMQGVIMDRMRSSRLARAGSALPPHKEAAEGELIDMNGATPPK